MQNNKFDIMRKKSISLKFKMRDFKKKETTFRYYDVSYPIKRILRINSLIRKGC